MKSFIIVLNLGRDISKVIKVKAKDGADAFMKCSKYCVDEGYFPFSISLSYADKIEEIN